MFKVTILKIQVRDAIAAGIFNDLGSGSNVDVCVIRTDGVDYKRTYDEANKKGEKQNSYKYPKGKSDGLFWFSGVCNLGYLGTTAVLTTKVMEIEEVAVKTIGQTEEMETL